jgi:chromosome partitioning protein
MDMLTKTDFDLQREHLPTLLGGDSEELVRQLQSLHQRTYPPKAQKTIRDFSPSEAAHFIGISDHYIKKLAQELELPVQANGRRQYSIKEMQAIRELLQARSPDSHYIPHRKSGDDIQVLSVVNFKGGSGKTTTAAHLAQYFALRGYRTLAIDLDPQASLSVMFGFQPELDVAEDETLYAAIRYQDAKPIRDIVRTTYIDNLDVIPGNLELMEFEHDTPKAIIENPSSTIFFSRIDDCLSEIAPYYDLVVIDCPPQMGFLTMSALCASTSVLITVHPEMLDILSMSQFVKMTTDLMKVIDKAGGRTTYNWIRYMMTRFEPNDGPQTQMAGFMKSILGNRVLSNAMLKSTAISDAGITKQTIYEIDRTDFHRNTYDRALTSMNAVNNEIETLVKKVWRRA